MSAQPSSTLDRATALTKAALPLAVVPVLATLLDVGKVVAMTAPRSGGGMKFPFPTGLPTLWTFTSVSTQGSGVSVVPTATMSLVMAVPLLVVGFLLTSALEAGFLGSLARRAAGRRPSFSDAVTDYVVPILVKNVLSMLSLLLALPFFVFPPLAVLVSLVVSYFIYGMPFVIVVEDVGAIDALRASVGYGKRGGAYLTYGVGFLVVGAVASVFFTSMVYGLGLLGVLIGAVVVAVPSVFLAALGVVVFRSLSSESVPALPA
ncbi:MAG: hypothetical protein ABEJ67_01265 [Halanaeroarchaeum sp.]